MSHIPPHVRREDYRPRADDEIARMTAEECRECIAEAYDRSGTLEISREEYRRTVDFCMARLRELGAI